MPAPFCRTSHHTPPEKKTAPQNQTRTAVSILTVVSCFLNLETIPRKDGIVSKQAETIGASIRNCQGEISDKPPTCNHFGNEQVDQPHKLLREHDFSTAGKGCFSRKAGGLQL